MKTIIYCNTLLTPFQRLDYHSIVIESGVISALVSGKVKSVEDDLVIDAGDLIVTPGLIDVHVHGACGFDVNDATEEANLAMSRFHATTALPATAPHLLWSAENCSHPSKP